jgi:hypothetical protein
MTLSGAFPEPHTLAQFARRAGISEGRARALFGEGKLPKPDHVDAGGRPLWSATTIDAWCRQTGRPLGEKVAWLHRAAPATEPAPVLFQGVIPLDFSFSQVEVYAIVWDTPNGHLIYLTPVYGQDGNGGAHPDEIAMAAASLVRPAFWPQALIVQPITGDIGRSLSVDSVYLNLHRLDTARPVTAAEQAGGWLRRRRTRIPEQPGQVRVQFNGIVEPSEVAAVIGMPVPVWIEGTCTADAVKRAQAYNSTFTVPDTVTDWPPARDQVLAALDTRMADTFPAGFAALAAHARDTFEDVRALHDHQPDEGDGWYLAARPAPPDLPFAAELAISTAQTGSDLDAVALELTQLRDVEANLSTDAPEGDAYETAVGLLTWQLRQNQPSAVTGRFEIYGDTYGGPVVDQWRQTLQSVDGTALSTRRVRRLLGTWDRENLLEVLRDPGGMHVAVLKNDNGDLYFHAEWPYDPPQGWNERTIIAADRDSAGAVFALTPTAAGHMKVDPLPLEPGTGPSFGYGYDGGSPYTLYQALIRCAFGTPEAPFTLNEVEAGAGPAEVKGALWQAITTTKGPLRLPWPTVLQWARADAAKAGYTGNA